jgi:hypothetical protein
MFPIRDDQPSFSTPYVNYFIIALNVLVYVFAEIPTEARGAHAFNGLIFQFGLIPHDFTLALRGVARYPLAANLLTVLTSMFMHGGFLHILGNMWFLWIFGDNIEDRVGHFGYLIFYLLCGIAAALTYIVLTPNSTVPLVGASGAIAGVMGAYLILYPRARVLTWVFFIFFLWLPAWIWLGFWFLGQFFDTVLIASGTVRQNGGVAFAAHVGGFITGLILIKVFPRRTQAYRYGS